MCFYHREYALDPSVHGLSRGPIKAAMSSHAVDVDIGNCHPQIFMLILQDLGIHTAQDFPKLSKYCKNYNEWQCFGK